MPVIAPLISPDQKEKLFEHALDSISDGIQIYDQGGRLVYLNKTSRDISGIPHHMSVEGQHLMDLYALDEEVSTVMTALRTRRPVINRFDSFKSATGDSIVSVNTAYPIFDSRELIGSVVFELDLAAIDARIEKLEEMKKIIREKASLPVSKFSGYQFSDLIGRNAEFLAAVTLAKKIAPQHCNALLVGETGTGKEIFAQSIHKASARKNKKLVAVNCAAVPDTLIESAFFGTSKGSFTGSVDRPGLLEEASGGALFLDELNSMSLGMQSKLLRVIQEGSFRRVGGGRDLSVDVRFISSCNEDPALLIERNVLRKDLFYRLAAVTVEIPPLRERLDDLDELIRTYLSRRIDRYFKSVGDISPEVMALFRAYPWPGNVRELFNALDFVLNTIEGERVELNHLPKHLISAARETAGGFSAETTGGGRAGEGAFSAEGPAGFGEGAGLQEFLLNAERRLIGETLKRCRYKIGKAAGLLGVSRQVLRYRIKKTGLDAD